MAAEARLQAVRVLFHHRVPLVRRFALGMCGGPSPGGIASSRSVVTETGDVF